MADIPYWVPILSAVAGGGLVGFFNFLTNLINKKSEERRHMRELMLNTAVEHFKIACSTAGRGQGVAPLETFIIHLIKVSEVLMDTKITKENVVQKLKDAHAVSAEVESYIKAEEAAEKKKKAEERDKIKQQGNTE